MKKQNTIKKYKRTQKTRKKGGKKHRNKVKVGSHKTICYTGIGAKKRNHTEKAMEPNLHFCSFVKAGKSCKSCNKYKSLIKEWLKNNKQEKYKKKLNTLHIKCKKCRKKKLKKTKCNIEDYIEFSGAKIGKC